MALSTVNSADDKDEKGVVKPIPNSEFTNESVDSRDSEKASPEYGSTADHIFANEQVADYWAEIYEKAQYEGRHRFDPSLTWSAEEEKKLRLKVGSILYPMVSSHRAYVCAYRLISVSLLGLGRCLWR
jgi:hypothetical protein